MLDRPIHRDQSAWTEDRTELLTKLWTDGKSASECAMIIGGVTRNAVSGKATRLKLVGGGRGNEAKRQHGNKGQPKAASILRRVATNQGLAFKIAKARKDGLHVVDAMEAVLRHKPASEYKPSNPAAWEPLGDAKPISLMDLPNRPGIRCRWPVTGGYCGIKSGTNTYCEQHHRMAYK